VSAAFDLPLDAITAVARDVANGHTLWSACRSRARTSFGGLAQVRSPRATWDDLVLPEGPLRQLRGLAAAIRHRHRVLDDWGFADRATRGLGSSALFAGPSGTGKTLAAEVLAAELGLDLVQVDLSQVVSKYLGESEKHLRQLFDAAEGGGAVLLFDEADALFGRRTEVHDSHDRYANVEVGYLLQRMEEFRGLAVLTTNTRSSLDPAFSRRLSSVVSFPYPDEVLREQLWRKAFPARTPARIDAAALAKLDLPGGGIAAAALTAAYLAAADDEPVDDRHVAEAARWELAKSGRNLAAAGAGHRPWRG
jgi:SpoVK/Ycf46/Vps4 family AAA+-type ATPase